MAVGVKGKEKKKKKKAQKYKQSKGQLFFKRESCGAKLNEPSSFKSAMVNAVNM